MLRLSDFTGCKVFIHDDEHGQTLADTAILNFDKSTFTITVRWDDAGIDDCGRVSLLILYQNEVYEYKGTLRKQVVSGEREIALFNGQIKESRSSTRYAVNAPAKIENLFIANKLVSLRNPLDVLVINISASGVLMRTNGKVFNIGTAFQLKLPLNDTEVFFNASVKRISRLSETGMEYGCEFMPVTSNQAHDEE